MRKLVTCPEHGCVTEIEYHEDPTDGHIQGIVRCSILASPEDVDCDQECARRLNQRFLGNREEDERAKG
jgi:hypothetical protein